MYFCINGYDQTLNVPHDTNWFANVLGDPAPRAEFDVWDQGGVLSIDTEQEIIIWDERSVGNLVPSMNFLLGANLASSSNWTPNFGGGNPAVTFGGSGASMVFTNVGVGTYLEGQTTLYGYVRPGQQYMLSIYVQATSPVNLQSILNMQFKDASLLNLGSLIQDVRTPPGTTTRITITGTAPAGAYILTVNFGAQATNATNSGTINFSAIQLEPMWFTAEGVSYPTPDCNASRADSALMPDGTVSRMCRVFAGIIDDYQISWEGKKRNWHLFCAGSQCLLDDGMINATYSAQFDDQILTSVINTYFSGRISINAPNNSAPSPIIRAVLMDSQNYTDNNLREVANGLSDSSQSMFGIDPYYRFFYNPAFYNAAPFGLSQNPDNVSTFPIYDYQLEKDATQRKRKVKVIGGNSGTTPQVSQVLDQNATNVPVAPAYVLPAFDAKVNDSNLISTATTTTRGLAEVSKYGQPLVIITGKAQKYAPVGWIIYITLPLDNINNMPFVVQQVKGSYLGNALNQYEYTLGHYQPTLLDHIRNANKATNRARVATGVNNILQYDLTVSEIIAYSELITVTPGTSTPAGQYNSAYKQTALGDTPKAYYRLGEASGTTTNDISGNALNGTYNTSGVTYGVAGAILNDTDTAVTFDGTAGYMALPAGVSPAGLSAFSFSLWFKPGTLVASTNHRIISNANTGSSNAGFDCGLNGSTGGVFFAMGNGTTNAFANSTTNLVAGTWYHLVGTFDGSNVRFYLNGILQTTSALSGTIASSGFLINIGRNPAYTGDYVAGSFDDTAVYYSTLSGSQVTALYNAGLTASGAKYGSNAYS